MKRFCVIGSPITHSLSPALHQAGLLELEIDATFEAIEVKPEDLEQFMQTKVRDYAGVAVTIPHKETVRKYLDFEMDAARDIGAVNTLFWKDKKLGGTNTDAIGALRAVQTHLDPNEKQTLILGAGGAARAVVWALVQAGARVTIWNRTAEKAQCLASHFECQWTPTLEEQDPEDFDLIINTTSVGLDSWESPLPKNFWQPTHTAFDTVYSPLETQFLNDAEAAGATSITGDAMLVHQALEQFHLWHDQELEPEVMARAFFGGN